MARGLDARLDRRPGVIRAVVALTLVGLLAACEGGGDPVEQALRETAAAHQAAATRTTAEIEAAAAPISPTTDQVHVARMIVHNEEATATARAALRDSRDPQVRRMAQAMVDARSRESAEMRAWTPTAPETN